ncbi:MAG TPA: DUF4189 domain-containing protein [Pseudonocardia sp.]|jgi:hypothetical protein
MTRGAGWSRWLIVIACLGGLSGCAAWPFGSSGQAADQSEPGYWASIAYSKATGRVGYSNNRPNQAEADASATQTCRSNDCAVVAHVRSGCVAIAQAPKQNLGWVNWVMGWGAAPSRVEAQRQAVASAAAHGARVSQTVCTVDHSGP